MDGNSGGGLAVRRSQMGVTVQGEYGPMPVNHLRQPGTAQVGPDFSWLTLNGIGARSIVGHDDCLLCPQHGEGALQFHGLINGSLDKRLDLLLAKSSEHPTPKTAHEALGSGKAHAIALVTAAVQHLYAFGSHELHKLLLLAALIIMV